MNTNKNDKKLSFDECFNKHCGITGEVLSVIAERNNRSQYQQTLSTLQDYDGSFELEDSLKAALIMHVALGNINKWNLDELIDSTCVSDEFIYDVLYNLENPSNKTKPSNLSKLEKCIVNNDDKNTFSFIKSEEKRLLELIEQTVIDPLNKHNKATGERKHINQWNEDSFGGIATFGFYIVMFATQYRNNEGIWKIVDSLTEVMYKYLIGHIRKGEFLKTLWQLQGKLVLSDGFHNGLTDYFIARKEEIYALQKL